MRTIAIVGAGHSGLQLALGLRREGYDVTLYTDKSSDEIRVGSVTSSQCMFESALEIERFRDLNNWDEVAPAIERLRVTVGPRGDSPVSWSARLPGRAQSVDQRVKCADWLDLFVKESGDLRIGSVDASDLATLASRHDLVVVSSGKSELARVFGRDAAKSPFDSPRRALALAYVRGVTTSSENAAELTFCVVPGVGEYTTFPALTLDGPCQILAFEGEVGGPMDRWDDIRSPQQHLARSLALLREFFPAEAERCEHVELTDDGATLRGRVSPVVRNAIALVGPDAHVLGMGDAVVLNDPLTGQGSNYAARFADYYLDSIVRRAHREFDRDWMQRTFDNFWRGWGQWAVQWTNSLLVPLDEHRARMLTRAADVPEVAEALATGFDDPRMLYPWWFDASEGARFVETKIAERSPKFEPRELRRALGQFASGVTVVTSRAPDGRRVGMTANSFTSVSLDPPLVLWCPSKSAPSLPDFAAATHFAVNVLAAEQHHISRQFATASDDKFAGVDVRDGLAGVPVLPETVACFECRTVARHDAGDHEIVVGEIERFSATGGSPLVFHSGLYQLATKHPDV